MKQRQKNQSLFQNQPASPRRERAKHFFFQLAERYYPLHELILPKKRMI